MSEALVSTGWLAERLDAPNQRIIECSAARLEDYERAHIPGAVVIDWRRDLIEEEDESSGLIIDPEFFAALARRLGIHPDDTLVFYGDTGGRHAMRALWTFEYYRHAGDLHVVDGGREKWQAEGLPMTSERAPIQPSSYTVPSARKPGIRATREQVLASLNDGAQTIVDTRTEAEHTGADIRAKRGGRIPRSVHRFWKDTLAENSALKPRAELEALYAGIDRNDTVTTYCQLGVRAAHTWFVLHHVLGYPNVRNYDGSWREWGDRDDTPIEGETSPSA